MKSIISAGVEGERLAWALVGATQHLAIWQELAKDPPRTTCKSCGGLRDASRRPCDVCHALATAQRRAHLISEIEFLKGTDTAENIARRLGYTYPNSLARVLQRAGRHDLARMFWRAAREAS